MAWINFSRNLPVFADEKEPLDAAKIAAVQRIAGSHNRRVDREGIGARV
jgi:hypothetical protein